MSKLEEMILENYGSIQAFAEKCQIQDVLIDAYCSGVIPFKYCTERNLQKICDALETTPEEVGFDGEYRTRFIEGKEVYKIIRK